MAHTAIVWNEELGSTGVRLFVVEGDYSSLHEVYINASEHPTLEDELSRLMYDETYMDELHEPVTHEEFMEAIRKGASFIVCGFLP